MREYIITAIVWFPNISKSEQRWLVYAADTTGEALDKAFNQWSDLDPTSSDVMVYAAEIIGPLRGVKAVRKPAYEWQDR